MHVYSCVCVCVCVCVCGGGGGGGGERVEACISTGLLGRMVSSQNILIVEFHF